LFLINSSALAESEILTNDNGYYCQTSIPTRSMSWGFRFWLLW